MVTFNSQHPDWYLIKGVDSGFATVYAGARKDSPLGKQLYEVLKDGRPHTMTLLIRCSEENSRISFLDHGAEITDIVSER